MSVSILKFVYIVIYFCEIVDFFHFLIPIYFNSVELNFLILILIFSLSVFHKNNFYLHKVNKVMKYELC